MRHVATFVGAAAVAATLGTATPAMAGTTAPPPLPPGAANAHWLNRACHAPHHRDLDVTKKVYTIAKHRDVGRKVMLATFEAGWVESHMNNLNCGDAVSVGVFQQRPGQGWCDKMSQCRNVRHATNAFLDVAVPNHHDHPEFGAGKLAQSVQRSAYPDRYGKAKHKAKHLIKEAKHHAQAAGAV